LTSATATSHRGFGRGMGGDDAHQLGHGRSRDAESLQNIQRHRHSLAR
jgi:hypothetical protein